MDKYIPKISELRQAQLKVLGSGLDEKRGFLRELLLDVEMELDDYGYIEYLEDQIARCFEEEDYNDLEHYKSQILDLMMHSLGLATYESAHIRKSEPVKTKKK